MKDQKSDLSDIFVVDNSQEERQVEAEEKQLSEYYLFTGIKGKERLATIAGHLRQKFSHSIRYDPTGNFHQAMSVQIIRHTKHYEFVDLQVRMGHFIFPKISVFNYPNKSPVHVQAYIGKGGYGKVYKCRHQDKQIAIKCFQNTPNKLAKQTVFRQVLKEYCLLKIASILKAGPYMQNIFGYDIVIYDQCIEISMELCRLIQNQRKTKMVSMQAQLKGSLVNLHSLHIIHSDIKLQNIAFSPTFDRYVFLDYGLGKIIKQSLECKSLTGFVGTILNCTPQMRKLYNINDKAYFSLYHNDSENLKQLLIQMRQVVKGLKIYQSVDNQEYKVVMDLAVFHKLYHWQYSIFQWDQKKMENILSQNLNQQITQELINFLNNVNFSSRVRRFSIELLKRSKNGINIQLPKGRLQLEIDQSQKLNHFDSPIEAHQSSSVQFYLMQLRKKSKESLQKVSSFLKNQQKVAKIGKVEYLRILGKAIQVNSMKYHLDQVKQFCCVAIGILAVDIGESDRKYKHVHQIAEVSRYLCIQSLKNKLEGHYFHIFLCMLSNSVSLKLFTFKELLNNYDQVIDIPLKFAHKVRVLLNFNTVFVYLMYQDEYDIFQKQLHRRLSKRNEQLIIYLKLKQFSLLQLKIFKGSLYFQDNSLERQEYLQDEILPIIGYDNQLWIDLRLWMEFQINSRYLIPNDYLDPLIYELLVQKQAYQTYNFGYIDFLLIFYEYRRMNLNKVASILKKYVRVQVFQEKQIIEFTNLVIQAQKRTNLKQKRSYYVRKIQDGQQTFNNLFVCHYLCQFLFSLAIFITTYHKSNFSQLQIFEIYVVYRKVFDIYCQKSKKNNEFITISQQIERKIYIELSIKKYAPTFSKMSEEFDENRLSYIRQYELARKILAKKTQLVSFLDILYLMLSLACILIYNNQIEKAIKLYKDFMIVIKAKNDKKATFYFFLHFFNHILPKFQHKSHQFIQFYEMHIKTIENCGRQVQYINNMHITIRILKVYYETDHAKLLNFIKAITSQLQIYSSRKSINKFITMLKTIYLDMRQSESFIKGNIFVEKHLSLKQNPYLIIWHYVAQLTSIIKPKISFCYFFFKNFPELGQQIRQLIFQYALFNYLFFFHDIITRRKAKRIFILITRSRFCRLTKPQMRQVYKVIVLNREPQKIKHPLNLRIRKKNFRILEVIPNRLPFDKEFFSIWMDIWKDFNKYSQKNEVSKKICLKRLPV